MKYCTKCVQPDTRPNIYFNKEGVCGACLWEEEKKKINWKSREEELKKIAAWAKREAKKRKTYDCVIGVSGGKDSTFQALYTRDRLGLRALLVNGEPEERTTIGNKNIENLKKLGFDCIALRPNPKIMKKLIKKDFYEFLNPVKVTEFSLWASAYLIADKFNIPLVLQGENAALTLGVSTKQEKTGNAFNYLQLDTLSSGWQRYMGNGVNEMDLFMFKFDLKSLIKKKTKAIWLQYYVKEWSQAGNAEFAIKHGLTIRKDNLHELGRLHKHSALDSDMQMVNQMFKYMKFGFGFATDEACYDIRDGRLTREKAFKLVKKYDGLCGKKYIKQFSNYMGISLNEFWRVAESFRNKNLFEKINGKWKLKNAQ